MKNYFNQKERTRHIILMAMQTVAKDIDGDGESTGCPFKL